MSASNLIDRRIFLSIPVDDVTYTETLEWINQKILVGELSQICTVNPEFVITAQNHARFRSV